MDQEPNYMEKITDILRENGEICLYFLSFVKKLSIEIFSGQE